MRLGPEHGLTRRGLADLLDGSYAVPQNPLISCPTSSGLGDLSSDFSQFTSDLTSGNISQAFGVDTISGVPVWIWASGLVVVYMFFFGGGKHSRVSRAGRAAGKAKGVVKKTGKAVVSGYTS